VVQKLTVAIRKQQGIKGSLSPVCLICISVARLELQRDNQISVALAVIACNLDCSVNIALESIHRRPYVLLHLKQLIDAQIDLGTMPVFNDGFGLEALLITKASQLLQGTLTLGVVRRKTSAQVFRAGTLLIMYSMASGMLIWIKYRSSTCLTRIASTKALKELRFHLLTFIAS
jgi:hypothetical protein